MSIYALRGASIPDHIKIPPELVIGIDAIDEQHRLLIAQLDYLNKAQDQTLDSEAMGECAYVIGQTLLDHFRTEEVIIRSTRMPADEINRHMKDHSRIIGEYVTLQDLIMTKPQSKIHDVVQTIKSWVIDHIADFDVLIKNYV